MLNRSFHSILRGSPSSLYSLLLLGAMVFGGCRGMTSRRPPMHVSPNMDVQEKFEAQEANPFFADDRAMRAPVEGTVARGRLHEDRAFYEGRQASGEFVTGIPMPVTMDLVERGRDRYDVFCAVCHGAAGDGQGIIMTGGYGFVPAPTYHSDVLREQPDGYLYDVISNGVRTMPPYAHQIPVEDRWAIVLYVRALQRSQNASTDDVPPEER